MGDLMVGGKAKRRRSYDMRVIGCVGPGGGKG